MCFVFSSGPLEPRVWQSFLSKLLEETVDLERSRTCIRLEAITCKVVENVHSLQTPGSLAQVEVASSSVMKESLPWVPGVNMCELERKTAVSTADVSGGHR